MERQIKFRAWDYKNKIMYDSNDIGIKPLNDRAPILTISSEGIFIRPDNEDFKLMQFTGVFDINDEEIYEGDLLSHKFYDKPVEVIFEDGKFIVEDVYNKSSIFKYELSTLSDSIEIIGNIFDNDYKKL